MASGITSHTGEVKIRKTNEITISINLFTAPSTRLILKGLCSKASISPIFLSFKEVIIMSK